MRIVSVINQKNYKVLLIDFDSSGNLTLACHGESRGICTTYEMMMRTCSAEDAIQNLPCGYDLIASNSDLAGVEGQITDLAGKIYRLKECMEELEGKYDWVLIDTPPNLGYLTVNALVASTHVLIPSEPDFLSASGILELVDNTIRSIQKHSNAGIKVMGIVLTRYMAHTNNSKAMTAAIKGLADGYGIKLFDTVIRHNVAVKNSQSEQKDIFQYNSSANAAKDYIALVDEILKEEAGNG